MAVLQTPQDNYMRMIHPCESCTSKESADLHANAMCTSCYSDHALVPAQRFSVTPAAQIDLTLCKVEDKNTVATVGEMFQAESTSYEQGCLFVPERTEHLLSSF